MVRLKVGVLCNGLKLVFIRFSSRLLFSWFGVSLVMCWVC